ncbi:DUF6415 family natural product biosynthesis protein [Streptomyces sp. NPDC001450]
MLILLPATIDIRAEVLDPLRMTAEQTHCLNGNACTRCGRTDGPRPGGLAYTAVGRDGAESALSGESEGPAVIVTVEHETAAHENLPLDATLTGAAIERVLDPRAQRPDRAESEFLALLLRGHLAVLAPEVQAILEAASPQDERLRLLTRRSLDEAAHLLAAPPTYTARGTVAVVPLARCCRDLHHHYAAASSLSSDGPLLKSADPALTTAPAALLQAPQSPTSDQGDGRS